MLSRAEVVAELGLLDEQEDPQLRAAADLAALICGAPIAAVSLLDADRLFFAAQTGLATREISGPDSFCAVTASRPDRTLELPDLLGDARYAGHPAVLGDPNLRSYTGVPLVLEEGLAVGALCVMDVVPRSLSAQQVQALEHLAAMTVDLLQARRTARLLQETVDTLRSTRTAEALSRDSFTTIFERAPLGLTVVSSEGVLLRVNQAFAALVGHTPEELVGTHVWELTARDAMAEELDRMTDLREGRTTASVREKRYLHADGSAVPTIATTSLVRSEDGGYVVLNQVEPLAVRREAETRMLEVQSAVDGIISIDAGGRVTSWNRGAERMLGHRAQDMLGRTLAVILPDALRAAHEAGVARLTAGGAPRLIGQTVELPARRVDGSPLDIELTLSSWADHGRVGYTAIVRDITERRAAQVRADLVAVAARAANDAETFAQAALAVLEHVRSQLGWVAARAWTLGDEPAVWAVAEHEHADDAPCRLAALAARGSRPPQDFVIDDRTRISVADDPARTGWSDVQPAAAGCRVRAGVLVPVLDRGEVTGALCFYVPEGADLPSPELVSAIEQIGLLLGRVSERESVAAMLRHQAHYDPLTGLANRRLLLEEVTSVQSALAEGTWEGDPALVVFDLDRFKLVNDSLGHAVGDLVLGEVTERLRALTGPDDTVARLGGDEFVVLVSDVGPALTPDTDPVQAHAQRLLDGVRGPVRVLGHELPVRLSAGACAITPEHAGSPELPAVVLRDADAALLIAKRRGKDRVEVFDAGTREDAATRLEDENALSRAIAASELTVHYQPVVDLVSGLTTVVEALVRWPRPGHGLVPPDRFIPLAEESGLIVELGRWVLERACHDAAGWAGTVPALADGSVSVNVSTRQLTHPRFLHDVDQALSAAGLPARRLTLEITESALVEDDSPALATMHALHDRGIRLALDDFGTGYSSLSYVQRLPVDVLKIDKSFVDLITGPGEGTAFTEVVLKLAEAMDLDTTAEGVETPAQAEALRALGCHRGQGWTWARAVPLDRLAGSLPVGRVTADQPPGPRRLVTG